MKSQNTFLIITGCLMLAFVIVCAIMVRDVFAMPSEADRIAIEARVRTELNRDLVRPYTKGAGLEGRASIDGRTAEGFEGDIIEYWVNLECTYCGVQDALKAQRYNEGIRIVVRHIPTTNFSESLKKALSYEALKHFSANAANTFWDAVIPKTTLAIPVPYEASLVMVFQEAQIDPEAFAQALSGVATTIVDADTRAAQGRIFSTPTYVIEGIRFPACNFTAKELLFVVDLAQKARTGDKEAVERIIQIIVNGLSNVPIFDTTI